MMITSNQIQTRSWCQIVNMESEIIKKAREKNQELGMEFYSEIPDDYVFLGKMVFNTRSLLLFFCRKCKSTIAIDDLNK